MKAGLVIKSYAFTMRYTLDSERTCPSRSVKAHASSRGVLRGRGVKPSLRQRVAMLSSLRRPLG